MSKDEQDAKKDIAKRLRWSNEKLWTKLSEEEQVAIVDKYYHFSDLEHVGIRHVLEDNRNMRRNLAGVILGLLLGLLGGTTSNILLKYIPHGWYYDMLFVSMFILTVALSMREIDKMSAEGLREDHVLEYFIKLVKKDDNQKSQK